MYRVHRKVSSYLWDNLEGESKFVGSSYEDEISPDSWVVGKGLIGKTNFLQVWVEDGTSDEGGRLFYPRVKPSFLSAAYREKVFKLSVSRHHTQNKDQYHDFLAFFFSFYFF